MAVNSEYYATASNNDGSEQRLGIFQLFNFIDKNQLIPYKGNNIPLKPVLEYLKNIEDVLEREIATRHYNGLIEEIEKINRTIHLEKTAVSVEDIAKKCGIPAEAALRIINSRFRIDTTTEDSLDKHGKTNFIVAGRFLLFVGMASKLRSVLEEKRITKFHDASLVFTEHGIPDECHTDLISKLGFEIVWEGIDYNAARIEKINS
jgi:hypothetical protein